MKMVMSKAHPPTSDQFLLLLGCFLASSWLLFFYSFSPISYDEKCSTQGISKNVALIFNKQLSSFGADLGV